MASVRSLKRLVQRPTNNLLRNAIRPKTQVNRIEQLKEIIRAWGANPEEILSKDALIRGNITETQDQTQNHQLSILAEQLKQIIRKEAT
jgi:hypothetical protein